MAMPGAAVVVPLKSFDAGKSRLSAALDAPARAALSRTMAERVLRAAGPLPVTVACDDEAVAAWALANGAAVAWTAGMDLNASVAAGIDAVRRAAGEGEGDAAHGLHGLHHVVVAHGDLPLADGLWRLPWFPGATLVPDRRDDGTNVLCVPTHAAFEPAYGPGSFRRHYAQLRALGLGVRVARIPALQWDVDEPTDLPD